MKKEQWRKEFDERYLNEQFGNEKTASLYKILKDDLKVFVAKTISQEVKKERGRTIEECRNSLPKLKTWGGYDGEDVVDDKENYIFNDCLAEIRKNLPKE